MIGRNGKATLEEAPILRRGDLWEAKRYLQKVIKAMDMEGWSAGQRKVLWALFRKWKLRALGQDPHFDRYGTFGRREGSIPPTAMDVEVAKMRQRELQRKKDLKRGFEQPARIRALEKKLDKEAPD